MFFVRRDKPKKPTFESIVEDEIPVLYRVAKTLTHNESDAEDLVGQTLLLAARAWDKFDGEFPRSWLIKILRNEFFGSMRKKANQPSIALVSVAEPSQEGYWEKIDGEFGVSDIMVELNKLPTEYRDAVSLCDVEELSYEEAAAAMDVPIGTVRSRLYRGRNILRARLVKIFGEEHELINSLAK